MHRAGIYWNDQNGLYSICLTFVYKKVPMAGKIVYFALFRPSSSMGGVKSYQSSIDQSNIDFPYN